MFLLNQKILYYTNSACFIVTSIFGFPEYSLFFKIHSASLKYYFRSCVTNTPPSLITVMFSLVTFRCYSRHQIIIFSIFYFDFFRYHICKFFKVGLSSPKKICIICLIESPLKVMKNVFYFTLKALFIRKIFKFLSRLFRHKGKTTSLER